MFGKKVAKFFNTAGPVNLDIHYKLNPLYRWDLEEIENLIYQKKYFILHAPRQSGKTSTLFALQKYINQSDKFVSIYVNVECAQVARHNVERGIKAIISQLGAEARKTLQDDDIRDELLDEFKKSSAENALIRGISYLSEKLNKKGKTLILLIDEIDALIGDTLVSVLRQLRTGYNDRPKGFPQSVILCGLVDIKDYKIHKSDGEIITGGSCFNIKAKPIRMGNFVKDEIKKLYLEHTKETGQVFEDKIFDLVWKYSKGQPWLVNALAYQVCFEMKANRDRTIAITAEMFIEAKEELILSRATHLDQLADKLKEERVRRVIEPLLIGLNQEVQDNTENTLVINQYASNDDYQYCLDLGLISKTGAIYDISNTIYREVLPRELANVVQIEFGGIFRIPEWINQDQSINVEKLLKMFVEFWRENSEIWTAKIQGYKEAAPHLVFQGYLQRVSNGHGIIEREFGFGTKRADLYLRWKSPSGEQRVIFELKIRTKRQNTEKAFLKLQKEGLEQTAEYADKCNATESHLLIFDRRKDIKWKEKIYTKSKTKDGHKIKIWGV